MPNWLAGFLESAAGLVPAPVANMISGGLAALAGLFGQVTTDVSGAWDDLTANLDALATGHKSLLTELLGKLEQIVKHWIPRYAITAWWWIEHPDQLAQRLLWFLLHQLERYAWTAGKYLGRFTLALLTRNVRHVAALAEEIITAVL